MPTSRFTKRAIEVLPYPEKGQVLYRDDVLRGFGLRVGTQSKVYFAEGQVNYRTRRVTIGRADVLDVDTARKRALAMLSDMAAGVDPNAEKRRVSQESVSLSQAFEQFFATRTSLAASTRSNYQRTADLYLKDWRQKPITSISRQMILKRHQRIAKDHGQVTANSVMRVLRSIYNVTAATYDDFPQNPVSILTQARAWFPERRRRGVIAAHELPAWWTAVMMEPEYSRDFLLIALFTGMRRSEVAALRWEYIDLVNRSLHIPNTKNGDPLDLPLSDFLVELLAKRQAGRSPWVFPSSSQKGHIVEPKKFTTRVSARSGITFTMHDLRRTFITIAESLDIPYYALKRMLNHRITSDVTAGYIVSDVDRLRDPVNAVATRILYLVDLKKEAA